MLCKYSSAVNWTLCDDEQTGKSWHFMVFFSLNMICLIFSSPGRSPGRAIVLPPALALVLASVLAAMSALAKC